MKEAGLSLRKRIRLRNKDLDMTVRFGTWNVCTLLKAGNMNIVAEEAERYQMVLVAFQAIRWKGKGSIGKSKFSLYYSGNDVRQGIRGVVFIVSKKVSRSVLGFSHICDRICTVRTKGKFHSVTFHNVYMHPQKTLRMK
jgi:hypothetical protein